MSRAPRWPALAALRQSGRRALGRLQLLWLVRFVSQTRAVSAKTAMVVAPHQDDEVLGCGGLIAMKRQAGVHVKIVFVTDGGASHDLVGGGPWPELPAVRRQEALAAAGILGVEPADVHFLEWPDGRLRGLDSEQRRQVITQLTMLLDAFRPGEVYVPHRHDRTDDHEATYELATAAVAASGIDPDVFQYAVWLLWSALLFRDFTPSEFSGARRVNIHAVRDQKRRALEAHRSQLQPRGTDPGPVLETGFLDRFCLPHEVFFQVDAAAIGGVHGVGRGEARSGWRGWWTDRARRPGGRTR